jgi:benzodiazapine receptor
MRKLLVSLVIPQLVGISAGLVTAQGTRDWYPLLAKPAFTPPSWLFAPVWTALYLMMGIACYLVWKRGTGQPGVLVALLAYGTQLTLNWLWSILFFGLRSPLAGLVDIVVLFLAIAFTARLFRTVSRPAGFLLLPYLVWVGFATVLNFEIWRLN